MAKPPADLTCVDLHLHSRYSQESDLWILRQAGVGESNTDPETVYKTCKGKGMTYVTLTDHNTIEGALRLAGHDDFFVSEEVTTYFPGEHMKIHLLALGIGEEQHREIQRLRPNLYELVAYLNQEDILYVLSHPLTRLSSELTLGHIERLMLLFPIWEVHNGSTLRQENLMSRRLAEQCSREKLLMLAEKHRLEPVTHDRIGFTAGSDDHAGFDLASAWTITSPTKNIPEFLSEVKAGRTEIAGAHGSTIKLAHTMLGVLAHGFENRANAAGGREIGRRGWPSAGPKRDRWSARKWLPLLSLATGGGKGGGLVRTVMGDAELRRALLPLLAAAAKPVKDGEKFHPQLFSLISASWSAGLRSTLAGLSEITLFNAVDNLDKIGRLVALQGLLLPHCLSANYHSRQRHFLSRLERQKFGSGPSAGKAGHPRVGLFTDTYDEVNGVTSILKRFAEYCESRNRSVDIISCGKGVKVRKGAMVRFPSAASVNLPEYGQLDLTIPSVLDVINHCEERGFELIHAATPGPMGMIAFLVSRILQVPLVASYHTDVPRCIGRITDDKLNEEAAWTFIRWFYRRSDLTLVPSVYTSRDLASHGFDHHKMAFLYQGVDSDAFSPDFRSSEWRDRLGGDDKKILLFAGRLSQEKDLIFLAECYLKLRARRGDIHLAIIGDGPLRTELESMMHGRATFTGWLQGLDLAKAFGSADLFVFPSSIDTSGQVILEAQASGLPVVLCSRGGACENIEPGVSGLTAPRRSLGGFTLQIETLLDNEDMRTSMARAARQSVRPRSWNKVFDNLFDTYADLLNRWQPLSVMQSKSATGDGSREDSALDFFLSLGN